MEKMNIKNRRYLGSKAKLLDFIKETVEKECGEISSFIDLFAGTGNVASIFNKPNIKVIVNDLLVSNYYSYCAWFGNDDYNSEKVKDIILSYNNLNVIEDNYFSINFANTYFSLDNSRKIGHIRQSIEDKYQLGDINKREYAILITALLYAMDRIANTVGHYDAYRLHGELNKEFTMLELDIPKQNINSKNEIYREDANQLIKKITADIVYIDPPYNSRQYCDAYHLLENVATWKKPEVFGVALKMDRDKSIKSKYCTKSATRQFSELIDSIDCKYILVSYNNMGQKGAGRSQAKIDDTDILKLLSNKGNVKVFETDFNQFNAGKTSIEDHKERLFLCEVGKLPEYVFEEKINGYAKSPLNYTGGKYKLLPQLLDKFPKSFDTFIDLFGGGFNVGANINAKKTVYNDKQKEVFRILQIFVKYDYDIIINNIEKLIKKYNLSDTTTNGYATYNCNSDSGVGSYNKDGYIRLREDYNLLKRNSENKDILLLTLIIFSFNNQIRFNSDGDFNMPVGKRDMNSSTRKNIRDFSIKLKNRDIELYSTDFRKFDYSKYDNPFIYCDPPYILGVASYNESNGWTNKDDLDLLNYISLASQKGVKFALSNVVEHKGMKNDVLVEWAINNRFNIIYLNANYNNSNYQIKDKEAITQEVLITNF